MNFEKLEDSKLIFSVPIYYRSLEEWHNGYTKAEKQYIDEIENRLNKLDIAFSSKERIQEQVLFNKRVYLWKYNEIISYLEIRYIDKKLIGYLYKSTAERYSSSLRNKNFKPDFSFTPPEYNIYNKSNKEIKIIINKIIDEIISKYKKFAAYYVDKEILENTINVLDFDSLK